MPAVTVAGLASETPGSDATTGFFGWSPETDRTVYTVRNGWDGTAAVAYATLTAYAVGKAVTDGGITYVVRTTVTAANTTAPAANASMVERDNHRGQSEFNSPTVVTRQYTR